jgi:uncharacterized protein YndB with AHSA1/START domain
MAKRASTTVRYETRTTIDRPIGDVFARLADLDGYRTWMRRTGLFRRSGQTSDGPVGLGTAYFDATRMGTFRGEVTGYQPPAQIGFRETLRWFGFDLMEARPEYFLEAAGDKTIVHHVAEGELFGMMRLMKHFAYDRHAMTPAGQPGRAQIAAYCRRCAIVTVGSNRRRACDVVSGKGSGS